MPEFRARWRRIVGPPAPLGRNRPPGGPIRSVMDAAPVMIWVSGTDKLCTWCNKLWLEFTGGTPSQELGNRWAEGVHPEDLDRCLDIYATHFDARQRFRMQYRLRRHDGKYRWIDHVGIPRHARDGAFLGYIGSYTDIREASLRLQNEITSRAQTEGDLARSSGQLEVLVDGIQDYAIYMVDAQGRVTSWNSGAARIKGYTSKEIIGQDFSIFYTEADRKAGVPSGNLLRAARQGRHEAEGWRRRKDGTEFWANVLINPIYNNAGQLLGFAKVTRDETEKRRAQELLAQARERMLQLQKMEAIGQLTGEVAHDFNNLLQVIVGNLENAERNTKEASPSIAHLQRAIAAAMRGARRASMLTQRLLAFSRRQPLNPKPLDMNKFIAAEVEFLQRSLGETVDVQAVGSAGLWRVEADVDQLQAVLVNIAVNARDAMAEVDGKLTLETSNAFLDEEYCKANPEVTPGQYVLISVTDNGIGMSKDVVDRAFEPFFSTKPAGKGTGLGLSQVYGFIKQSGGHVKIYSEPGDGTTVKIYLPRLQAELPLHDENDLDEPAEGERGETILVVEDDEDVRTYLVETLRDLGYSVLPAHDAVAGLGYVNQSGRIDLLLTDVVLPGMSGRDMAQEARKLRASLKVLFMTGYSRNAIIHQGRLDPGVELIQKPVTQDQLAARIRALLDRAFGSQTHSLNAWHLPDGPEG